MWRPDRFNCWYFVFLLIYPLAYLFHLFWFSEAESQSITWADLELGVLTLTQPPKYEDCKYGPLHLAYHTRF